MANEKMDVKKLQEELFASTRRVWLAGLGVLSTVEEETQQLFTEPIGTQTGYAYSAPAHDNFSGQFGNFRMIRNRGAHQPHSAGMFRDQ